MTFSKLRNNIAFALLILYSVNASAQRLGDHNTVFWAGGYATIKLPKNFSLWMEYQFRREDLFKNWQQSMPRAGIQYHFNKDVSVMAGYAYAVTYPYGDYPSNPLHPTPEHRIFEQLSWNDNRGRISLNHRMRLEQRLHGKVSATNPEYEITGWNYTNRFRYQLRIAMPLSRKEMQDKTLYAAAYDEIFIGFGEKVNQNVFDQNRSGLLLGYQFNKTFRIEAGAFAQILQQGGLVSGKQVYQYNLGPIVNLHFTK
jgi:hypothetical protein